jgi:hypothetical protein
VAEKKDGGKIVRNVEAQAMDKIAIVLEPLGPSARVRVLAWVNQAYAPEALEPVKPAGEKE